MQHRIAAITLIINNFLYSKQLSFMTNSIDRYRYLGLVTDPLQTTVAKLRKIIVNVFINVLFFICFSEKSQFHSDRKIGQTLQNALSLLHTQMTKGLLQAETSEK